MPNQLKLNIFSPIQIEFKNRKKGDKRNDCLLSVHSTNFWIAMGYSKTFWSYKFRKSGVRYEVGFYILMRDICWWNGPYSLGSGIMG
jgi:hypothetical protein